MGYSPLEICKYHQSCEPLLDEMVCLKHIARVCKDAGLPFSKSQIKRVFNKFYNLKYHGSKSAYWKFISQECSNKLIVFKSDHRPKKNLPVDPHFQKNKARDKIFSSKLGNSTEKGEEGLK